MQKNIIDMISGPNFLTYNNVFILGRTVDIEVVHVFQQLCLPPLPTAIPAEYGSFCPHHLSPDGYAGHSGATQVGAFYLISYLKHAGAFETLGLA